MNYEIKKGIPIPTVPQSSGQSIYPWHFMEDGDCFDVPIGKHKVSILRKAVASNANRHKRRTGAKFKVITRTIIEDGILRVWILKDERGAAGRAFAASKELSDAEMTKHVMGGGSLLSKHPHPTPPSERPRPFVVKRWGPGLTNEVIELIKKHPADPPGVMLKHIHAVKADYILDVRAQELMDNWADLRKAAGLEVAA